MKIRILSDLHLEFINSNWIPPSVDCDVVVLAGDIHLGAKALPWITEHFNDKNVVYVLGNHEGYHHDLHEVIKEINAYESDHLRFLDNEWTSFRDPMSDEVVWFFGGTLWTDFNLYNTPIRAMQTAAFCMNDYRLIQHNGQRLNPLTTKTWHEEAVQQIQLGLAGSINKRVVVTHHAPSEQSISPGYRAHDANPAYASNLEWMCRQPGAPALWVHGHMHRSSDYLIDNTRVVANPKGYPSGDGRNPDFDPTLVVEV